jgi:outer membrane murein-binding lipoprotein Lpp
MSTTPSPTQSELSKGSLPIKKPLVEVLTIDPANLKNDQFQSEWRGLHKRVPLALTCLLITFCIGVAATLAWLSYAAREAITSSFPRFSWLAPQAAPVAQNTPEAVRLRVDQLTTSQEQIAHNVDQLTASQEQIAHNVDQLTASQEQIARNVEQLTREIKAIDEYIRSKNSEPPAPKHVPRPSQQRTVR